MPRPTALLLSIAALSATAAVSLAQTASPAGPTVNSEITQSQPAPIVRTNVSTSTNNDYTQPITTGQVIAPGQDTASAQAASGIFLRVGKNSTVKAVNVSPENTELRVVHGVANVSVHEPIAHSQILVDLPGGQTALVKDGFYTFNADTNTVRVLKGEGFAYVGNNQKSIKIKENHAVIFGGLNAKSFEFDPFEARADLIPYATPAGAQSGPGTADYSGDYGDSDPGAGYAGYGFGAYGYPYGGYPYYGFDSFYGDPYGFYPFGLGLYGGGFYGGGYYGGGYYGGGYYGHGFRGDGDENTEHGGRGPRAGGGGSGGFHGGNGGFRGGGGGFRGGSGSFHGGGGFGGVGHAGGGGGHAGGGGGAHR